MTTPDACLECTETGGYHHCWCSQYAPEPLASPLVQTFYPWCRPVPHHRNNRIQKKWGKRPLTSGVFYVAQFDSVRFFRVTL